MKKRKDYQINSILAPKTTIGMEGFEFMNSQIKEIGRDGMLHFTIKTHKKGWTAQCEEIEGIVTGNTNPNPSQDEINTNIRNAIFTAFNVQPKSIAKKSNNDSFNALIKIESCMAI